MYSSMYAHSWGLGGPVAFLGIGFLGVAGLTALVLALVVMVILKGFALWYAAKRDEKWWFIVMLVVNTAGILEVVYLVFFVHKWHHKISRKHQHDGHTHDGHQH